MNKGLVIEFTSLLDVILIMLFWVMMTSSNRVQQAEEYAEEQIAEAAIANAQALEEADNKIAELDRYLQTVEGFENGEMLTISVTYTDGADVLSFSRSDKLISSMVMDKHTDAKAQLMLVLGNVSTEDNIILCAFIYDGSTVLYRDVQAVKTAFEEIRDDFDNVYFTMVNTSP